MLFAGCLRAQLLSASKRGFLLGLRHKTHATSVYKEEARKLLLLNGAALVLAALGLLLLFFAVWFFIRCVVGFVNLILRKGREWCYDHGEVDV